MLRRSPDRVPVADQDLLLSIGVVQSGACGQALYLTRTKSGKPREIPLSPEAMALLPERQPGAGDEDLVFLGRDGGTLRNNLDRASKAAREGAGLRWLRVHDLRHEAASRFLEAGGTLRGLQELGGWSSLELVERYSKVTRERIRKTLCRVRRPGEIAAAQCTVSARADEPTSVAFAK
jgi:integrase